MTMQVSWYGEKAKRQGHRGAARGLFLWAEHVLTTARPLTPHETGDLERDSASSVDEGELRAAVSFGFGAGAAYAIPQHEEMTWHHDPGRQAKYLEQPLNSEREIGLRLVQREIKAELRS
jgi:hypothetical protein